MTLIIPSHLMSDLVADARQRQPSEACGLLIGVGRTVQQVLPLPNSDLKPQQGFILSPQSLATALYQIEAQGLDVVGIYHSHPRSGSFPSERDIEGATQWPKAAQVIISLQGERPRVQAWQMSPGQVDRMDITFASSDSRDIQVGASARAAIIGATFFALLILIGLSISLLPAASIITPVP